MKTIVTHIGPDLDAMTSIWLVKTRIAGWEEAALAFVPAGKTLDGMDPDGSPDVMHVDTGFGRFDHHQTDEDTCAALRVYSFIKSQNGADPVLERMLAVVNDIDHFREVYFPNPTADFYNISLVSIIDGWRLLYGDNPDKIVALTMEALDGVYIMMRNKVWAEGEIAKNGREFHTKWGKGLAVETVNDEVVHQGQKMGYALVVRRDPKKAYLRIKALPKPEIDLSALYEELKKEDPQATWFLHASHHMILNGSAKNPDMKPSTKSLDEILAIIASVCA